MSKLRALRQNLAFELIRFRDQSEPVQYVIEAIEAYLKNPCDDIPESVYDSINSDFEPLIK